MPLNFYERPLQIVEQIIRDLIAADPHQKLKREGTDIVKNKQKNLEYPSRKARLYRFNKQDKKRKL